MRHLSVAPTLTQDLGRPHASRAGYDLRLQQLDDHERRLPGRPLPLQRRLHAREQRRGAERSRRSRGRSSCSGCRPRAPAPWRRRARTSSQFEIASPGDFRQTSHGLFVQDDWRVEPTADAEPRRAARDQRRHDAKSEDRNLAGFDTDDAEPDRGGGAGRLRARTRFREIPVGRVPASRAACCSPTARSTRRVTKVLPRAARLVPARRADGAPRRRRPVLLRLLLREHQPGRLLAGRRRSSSPTTTASTFTGATSPTRSRAAS